MLEQQFESVCAPEQLDLLTFPPQPDRKQPFFSRILTLMTSDTAEDDDDDDEEEEFDDGGDDDDFHPSGSSSP